MRSFAIVPAAGQSSRMGRPKLLLPLGGRPLIEHTLAAWRAGGVTDVLVVVRGDDAPLAEVVRASGATLVVPPTPPPDMKASLQAALRRIEGHFQPQPQDCFLFAPADMPRLSPAIIERLLQEHARRPDAVLLPTLGSERGHPVLFPWRLAGELHALAPHEGPNVVVRRHQAELVPCDELLPPGAQPFADIDDPDDYRRLAGETE